jgi:hypothetical protein
VCQVSQECLWIHINRCVCVYIHPHTHTHTHTHTHMYIGDTRLSVDTQKRPLERQVMGADNETGVAWDAAALSPAPVPWGGCR